MPVEHHIWCDPYSEGSVRTAPGSRELDTDEMSMYLASLFLRAPWLADSTPVRRVKLTKRQRRCNDSP